MTDAMDLAVMAEADEIAVSPLRRWLRLYGLATGALFFIGVAFGFLNAHFREGGEWTAPLFAIIAAIVVAALVCAWSLARALRKEAKEEPLTRREKLNRRILIASQALGVGTVLVLALSSPDGMPHTMLLSEAPLPVGAAILLIIVTGLLLPALSVSWHRSAVDEQEAAAYKSGALMGLYLFMIGAPVWWFAWRGGFAPEPNGFIIYAAVILTVGVIWTWKKYR